MATSDRGFASMDRAKQRAIASLGGRSSHFRGHAHEWSAEEAREAGRKGGLATKRNRALRAQAAVVVEPPSTAF